MTVVNGTAAPYAPSGHVTLMPILTGTGGKPSNPVSIPLSNQGVGATDLILPSGTYTLQASYTGDAANQPATSASIPIAILQVAPEIVSLSPASGDRYPYAKPIVFSASLQSQIAKFLKTNSPLTASLSVSVLDRSTGKQAASMILPALPGNQGASTFRGTIPDLPAGSSVAKLA